VGGLVEVEPVVEKRKRIQQTSIRYIQMVREGGNYPTPPFGNKIKGW